MIENTPPKGVILSDFIRTFAILDSVSAKNLFFCNTETSDFLIQQNFEQLFVAQNLKSFYLCSVAEISIER
jgi:hypothetical protein